MTRISTYDPLIQIKKSYMIKYKDTIKYMYLIILNELYTNRIIKRLARSF